MGWSLPQLGIFTNYFVVQNICGMESSYNLYLSPEAFWNAHLHTRDDPIYFVRFELPLIPLIDWNLEILHKCHNYFELYKLLLMSKSILVALFWTPYFFLSALVAFFGLSCPLQSWKHQHTNEKCYQNNILCLVNKNYDFFCNLLINFISNYQI